MTNVLPFIKPAPLFDDFWAIYPRKRAKAAARKAFAKIRWTPEKWAQLEQALEWQKREWSDPRFIPHPATYLNQERWEDEPDEPPEPCAWRGCTKTGVVIHGVKVYCENHRQALERGETPVGR